MPYEIIKQGVGLRPAIQARRPIIGMHAQYKNIGIMNAMGAKGTSLAPYYASQFSQFLLEGKELDKEVSLKK
jgi:glycine/D-amino acid oxidase-like deaminating enzyme